MPWQKKKTSSPGIPKFLCSAKKARVGASVAGLVITYQGMRVA
jgi:hypothetical protein